MSTNFLLSFGLISFLLLASFISCSSLFLPIDDLSNYENKRYSPTINSDDNDIEFLLPNDVYLTRYQRSSKYYPRASRNTWFRVATYHHFQPSGSGEIRNGDHPMRWGR